MKHLEELLQKISQGDVAALEVFYTETKGALYGYALSILKNGHDAEDVLQDCYVQVYTKAGTYQAQGKPMAWLMTIVKNLCLIKLGEQKRLQSLPEDYGDTYWDDDRSSDIGDRIILQTILRELPEEDREIILLHVLFGYKHREIASSLLYHIHLGREPPRIMNLRFRCGGNRIKTHLLFHSSGEIIGPAGRGRRESSLK